MVKICFRMSLTVSLFLLTAISVSQAQYSGGSGTAEDPYQIATAADLIALGETPNDYDKHFIMTADIDLDPNLPGRRVFDRAVIAPDVSDAEWRHQGSSFTGVFDGNEHTISNLTIIGVSYLGLFGKIGFEAKVCGLGLEAVNVNGTGNQIGGLAGGNGWAGSGGTVSACYSTGTVFGDSDVGGLVGENWGDISASYSTGTVNGDEGVGGLVGYLHGEGALLDSYSECSVSGFSRVGGLVGLCPATPSYAAPRGDSHGHDYLVVGDICRCYSTGRVQGYGDFGIGGLVGSIGDASVIGDEGDEGVNYGSSFWDIETSGIETGIGGTGLTTVELQTASTFLEAGWDFVGEAENGPNDVWKIFEGQTYPLLSWQKYGGGTGEPDDPYLIYTAEHLNALGAEPNDYDKHFKLMADIDLSGYVYDRAIIAPDVNDSKYWFQGNRFRGVFDGNGHVISHLTIEGGSYVGLFGHTHFDAQIRNLGLEDVYVSGTGIYFGAIVGLNWAGTQTHWSTGEVTGDEDSGVTMCFTTGMVSGNATVGGLVGENEGSIAMCYSSCVVGGDRFVGGLVGQNGNRIRMSYSTGTVAGKEGVGGLIGTPIGGTGRAIVVPVGESTASFWDVESTGLMTMCGDWDPEGSCDDRFGKSTAEMQTAATFLEAGWDFIGETENGTEDIWWIDEGNDYPRLWWELNN